jgi:hypothetical protein
VLWPDEGQDAPDALFLVVMFAPTVGALLARFVGPVSSSGADRTGGCSRGLPPPHGRRRSVRSSSGKCRHLGAEAQTPFRPAGAQAGLTHPIQFDPVSAHP